MIEEEQGTIGILSVVGILVGLPKSSWICSFREENLV
jgi:hypothetical protein